MGHWPKQVGLASVLATIGLLFSASGAGALPCPTCPGGGGGPTGDPTTTSVTATPSSAQVGQTVTFTATVKDSADSTAKPTGTVTFHYGAVSDTATLSGGTASYSVKPPLGSATVSASYTPSSVDVYLPSSGSATASVGQDITSTSLSSSKNPSAYGDLVSFTATVAAPYDSTTGSVTFKYGSTTLATGQLSGGKVTYTTSQFAVGSHPITAVYGGDADNDGSTSNTVTQAVNQDATATSLSSGVNPVQAGQAVTLTATVANTADGSLTPTGSVTFKDGASSLGSLSLNNGQATLTTSALGVGSHSVTASYSGAADLASSSATLTQTVNQDSTQTGLSSSSNPSGAGNPVTFTATVTAPYDSPSGSVTFRDGSTTLGTASLVNGEATYTTSALAAGSHSISAAYSGDTSNAGGSNGLTQIVVPASTNPGGSTTGSGGSTSTNSNGGSTSTTSSGSSTAQTPKNGASKPKSSGARCVKVSKKGRAHGKAKGKAKRCTAAKAKKHKKPKRKPKTH